MNVTRMVDTLSMEFMGRELRQMHSLPGWYKRMLKMERITAGNGLNGDAELLEELGNVIKDTAICGLGQTAPNPVLSTINNFRTEYEEHIKTSIVVPVYAATLSPCETPARPM